MMTKVARRNTSTRKRKEMKQLGPEMKKRRKRGSHEARKLMILKLFWPEQKA